LIGFANLNNRPYLDFFFAAALSLPGCSDFQGPGMYFIHFPFLFPGINLVGASEKNLICAMACASHVFDEMHP